MGGLCGHSNEPSGSLKYCRFLDLLGNFQLLKKDPAPCSWLFSCFMGMCVCVCVCLSVRGGCERERC